MRDWVHDYLKYFVIMIRIVWISFKVIWNWPGLFKSGQSHLKHFGGHGQDSLETFQGHVNFEVAFHINWIIETFPTVAQILV